MTCTVCYTKDVRLHPAVASGMVDLEFAGVVMPGMSQSSKTRPSRRTKTSNARWFTSKTEAERKKGSKRKEREKCCYFENKTGEGTKAKIKTQEEIQRKTETRRKAEF